MVSSRGQDVTFNRVAIRVRDAKLTRCITEKRQYVRVNPLNSLINAVALALLAGQFTRRGIESFTSDLRPELRNVIGVHKRISDSDIGTFIDSLQHSECVAGLHALVKAEVRRKTLPLCGLPFHWVAFDGKGQGTLDDWSHQAAQRVEPAQGLPYALLRTHRVVLISAPTMVCLHQRPIEGDTNEIGAMPQALAEVFSVYGHTTLLGGIVADAGNCSLAVATSIHEQQRAYALRLRKNQRELYREAKRQLAHQGPSTSQECYREQVRKQGGERVVRLEWRLWRADLGEGGYLGWKHARQLLRIERSEYDTETGELKRCGNRYWVSNVPCPTMKPKHWLCLARRYWRVENNANWTSDVIFSEDNKRQPLSGQAEALYAVSTLRMMVISILGLVRLVVRTGAGERFGYKALCDRFYALMTAPPLDKKLLVLV